MRTHLCPIYALGECPQVFLVRSSCPRYLSDRTGEPVRPLRPLHLLSLLSVSHICQTPSWIPPQKVCVNWSSRPRRRALAELCLGRNTELFTHTTPSRTRMRATVEEKPFREKSQREKSEFGQELSLGYPEACVSTLRLIQRELTKTKTGK